MSTETLTRRRRRAGEIIARLAETYPDVHCELDFEDSFQLLVATILSAQSTDRRVNLVTPQLFSRYPDAADLAGAEPGDLETIIHSVGFFRAKSETLRRLGTELTTRFGGAVPRTLEELVTLPGVGRKTANVVLGEAFGVPGITVDTHVLRLSARFGWTKSSNPLVVEKDLACLWPQETWTRSSQLVIWHGRRCCHARAPQCGGCPVGDLCPSRGAF
ncbi:MAG: endonuclease III [Propionibacteriaceae bacterium]|jgi:endonuclease-3|nr:endonuclease III [Propionibacteriaceae bacterium]